MALSDADDALAARVRAMFAREGASARRGDAREGAHAARGAFGADARIARCGAAVCAAMRCEVVPVG